MTETTTRTPAIDTIAEAARLTEYLRAMQQQAAKVEALARIAVLEAENAAQREQIIKLAAALNYGVKPPEGPCGPSETA